MLTRLQIKGFKNLRDVDLHFGPFTCIAGRNGVGKSNLFDAITFLSDLASMPLLQAALKVRGTGDRISGIENLFARSDAVPKRMSLIAEMVVPREVTDDYDRPATATASFLQYTLVLGFDPKRDGEEGKDPIFIDKEELVARPSSEADKLLHFQPGKAWIKRHVFGPGKRRTPFIETGDDQSIKLYGDLAKAGRPSAVPARKSPQTVLSGVNASSHPTALAARRELQSWRLLQLEPSALRTPDEYRGRSSLSATGGHLPNTLMRIGSQATVAQQLAELIPGIVSVDVDSDDVRQQRTLGVTMKNRERYAASSLSDGTLRFLALAVLASDPLATGLICLEEPENGIHPQRIPEMLRLVRSLAEDIDGDEAEDPRSATLRQVIINTHSPLVVAELPDSDLLMAETLRERRAEWIHFKPLGQTWRAADLPQTELIAKGELQAYLMGSTRIASTTTRRVQDHLTRNLFDAPPDRSH
ncbi:AAA family ATPase [Sphaerotilus sp.]|uniref:AAA family ATPase n=1 Tax=Sphaerotilus sp. TaxID=2093942 RepID=UPI002ACE9467|nr:AAA family ATPase [Sphaerotilus sp.]MDZ7856394.1 AAA family ATPase [Sphaerotilus sp.]